MMRIFFFFFFFNDTATTEIYTLSLHDALPILESVSYNGVVARGFVLVTDKRGHPLTTAADTHASMALNLQFKDGAVGAVVTESAGEKRPKPAAPAKTPAKQGSLL